MRTLLLLLVLLAFASGCAPLLPVSSATGTNMPGSPGTASDPATGGRDWPW